MLTLFSRVRRVYAVSEAFSENASNQEVHTFTWQYDVTYHLLIFTILFSKVCEAAVEPLVAQVQRGLPATILFYGQTGMFIMSFLG